MTSLTERKKGQAQAVGIWEGKGVPLGDGLGRRSPSRPSNPCPPRPKVLHHPHTACRRNSDRQGRGVRPARPHEGGADEDESAIRRKVYPEEGMYKAVF